MMPWLLGALVMLLGFSAEPVRAQTPALRPALVHGIGGRADKSFHESAVAGAKAFTAKTGIAVREVDVYEEKQREPTLRNLVQEGFDPIVAVGFDFGSAIETVAREKPGVRFAIIDAAINLPNVRSVLFKEQEGSFLVGVIAARMSRSGKVGFVGGMDSPLIRRFACGYAQGIRYAKPETVLFQNMVGDNDAAWDDPIKGALTARSQIDRGADIIYHAAGATGIGVLQAAADAGKFGIGVDSNQNELHPGQVLTSMLKRVDHAVEAVLDEASEGRWSAGFISLGLKEGGIGWALDDNNRPLIAPETEAAVRKATDDIKAGTLVVHDYMVDQKCPL